MSAPVDRADCDTIVNHLVDTQHLNLATVLALARAPASQAQLVTWVQSIEEVNDASKMMVVNAIQAHENAPVIGKRRGSNDGDAKAVKKNKKTKTQKNADNFVNAQWSHRIPSMEVENKTWESFTATEDGKEAVSKFISDILNETGEPTGNDTKEKYHTKLKRRYQYYHGKASGTENDDPNGDNGAE